MQDACQVAVLGGGPAGCAAAIALRQRGVERVRVVAPGRAGIPVGETLLPETGALLDRLGIWHRFLAEGHERCWGSSSTWGSEAVGYNDFIFNVWGNGWHLDRARFDAFLLAEAESAGAEVDRGARFEGHEAETADGVDLALVRKGGAAARLNARFVVDATGSGAVFARTRGARRAFCDRLVFVYGFFDAPDAEPAFRVTMVEAAETGWWYAAGLPEKRVAVAFAGDPGFVRESGMAQSDQQWLSRLLGTREISRRLDGCRLRPGLVTRAAPSGLSTPLRGKRWVAAGDAAASYDPLSGRGIYMALSYGIEAADAVASALESDSTKIAAYESMVVQDFDAYRAERIAFYSAETRWASSPFWRGRREH